MNTDVAASAGVRATASDRMLLRVEALHVEFRTASGAVHAARGIDFAVGAGEAVAVVGESGSGKSASLLGMLGLFNPKSVTVSAGRLEFDGHDHTRAGTFEGLLGAHIGVIFQDPQSSLNPTMRIGRQIGEGLRVHRGLSRSEAAERVLEALASVGIPDPQWCARAYPHQLSGGMRQRVMIALATVSEPELVVADEPTTALDPTLQAQIVDLLIAQQAKNGSGLVFVTHDLALASQFADRTIVMYAGQIVETGPTDQVVHDPRHPYTRALLASVPTIDGNPLRAIPGRPPDPRMLPVGCAFSTRCVDERPECRVAPGPESVAIGPGRSARCLLVEAS